MCLALLICAVSLEVSTETAVFVSAVNSDPPSLSMVLTRVHRIRQGEVAKIRTETLSSLE